MKSIRMTKAVKAEILESIKAGLWEKFAKNTTGFDYKELNNWELDFGWKRERAIIEATKNLMNEAILKSWIDTHGNKDFSLIPKEFLNFSGAHSIRYIEADGTKTRSTAYFDKPVGADIVLTTAQYKQYIKPLLDLRGGILLEIDRIQPILKETALVLDGYSTTKKLIEGWPNLEKYLPAFIDDASKAITLPELERSRLEERLNAL